MTRFSSTTLLVLAFLLFISPGRQPVLASPGADFYDEPGVRLLNQPLSEYRARRQKLMSEIKDGIVVILGNVEEPDGEARYRQNNWMAYLTGVRTPGAALIGRRTRDRFHPAARS
jgi:hypothetical protein